MRIDIGPTPDSAKPDRALRFLGTALIAGVAIGGTAAVCQNRSWAILAGFMMLTEALVALFVVATTIEVAKQHSGLKLVAASLALLGAPVLLIGILQLLSAGGHDSAEFAAISFTWASWICGFSLLVLALVRYIVAKQKHST